MSIFWAKSLQNQEKLYILLEICFFVGKITECNLNKILKLQKVYKVALFCNI